MSRRGRKTAVCFLLMTCMSLFVGCGGAPATEEQSGNATTAQEQSGNVSVAQEQDGNTPVAEEQDGETAAADGQDEKAPGAEEQSEVAVVANDGKGELISDEDAAALEFIKKYTIADVYGDGASYPVYAPDGSESGDDFLSYIDHGIMFFAAVYGGGDEELPYQLLNESLKGLKADWEQNEEYSDAKLGEVVKNGADRYVSASVRGKDLFGTDYEKSVLYYLDIPKTGVGVLWQVEVSEIQIDEMTEKLLTEIGQCYGIGLESIMPNGEWAQADAKRQADAQDTYEPEEGEIALTRVDGYQYLGQTTLSLKDGEIQCPAMAPMGSMTMVKEDHIYASMHGVSVNIDSTPTGTDDYVPLLKKGADRLYEQKVNDENRNVHKSEVMEMSGYENAWYYIVDYETPDSITGEYYREVSVNCRMIIEEKFALTCDITFRGNAFDTSSNALIRELEMAYGIDLSGYCNNEG